MARYTSPRAFEQALNHRIAQLATGTIAVRRLVCLDRYLARITAVRPEMILKGGLALKLRLPSARATKDIDLSGEGEASQTFEHLREAGRLDLGDFLEYRVHKVRDLWLPGMAKPGARYHAECRLAGRRFADPFHLDVSLAEPIVNPPELLTTTDWLAFAELPPARVRVQAIEAHVSEKLHAYTRPRPTANTRVRDLPDIALLAGLRAIDGEVLATAIEKTFRYRGTHDLMNALPAPDASWSKPYEALVVEHDLPWTSLADVTSAVAAFLDPILAGDRSRVWSPLTRSWLPR